MAKQQAGAEVEDGFRPDASAGRQTSDRSPWRPRRSQQRLRVLQHLVEALSPPLPPDPATKAEGCPPPVCSRPLLPVAKAPLSLVWPDWVSFPSTELPVASASPPRYSFLTQYCSTPAMLLGLA